MPNPFKPGDRVRVTGDDNVYTVHTVYPPAQVSLGLLDFPDTEQDFLTNTDHLTHVDQVEELPIEDDEFRKNMSMMYCHKHDRHYDSDYEDDCPECLEEYDEDLKPTAEEIAKKAQEIFDQRYTVQDIIKMDVYAAKMECWEEARKILHDAK